MKIVAERAIHICDRCGNETGIPSGCLKCGTEFCFNCAQKYAVSYSPLVFCSGSADGIYCKECDTELGENGADPLHAAYGAIELLRLEGKAWNRDFQQRCRAAEKLVRSLVANDCDRWRSLLRAIRPLNGDRK
jgi:hypothetical protein